MINRLAHWLGFARALPSLDSPREPFDPEDPDNWLSLDYVHDRVIAQLEAQSELWDLVDGRLRLILGVIGIVFAAALALQRGTTFIPFWAGIFAILAVLLFLAAGIIAVIAYWPRPFDRPPDPASLRTQYLTTDPRVSKLEVIDTIIQAYHKNEDTIGRKIAAFKWAFALTAVASGLLGGAIVVQVAFQTMPWNP